VEVFMRRNLLRVSRIPSDGSYYFARASFYKLHHLKKFPELFIKLGGGLFIDLDELDKIIEQGRGK
jgi:hypothetical protein